MRVDIPNSAVSVVWEMIVCEVSTAGACDFIHYEAYFIRDQKRLHFITSSCGNGSYVSQINSKIFLFITVSIISF